MYILLMLSIRVGNSLSLQLRDYLVYSLKIMPRTQVIESERQEAIQCLEDGAF